MNECFWWVRLRSEKNDLLMVLELEKAETSPHSLCVLVPSLPSAFRHVSQAYVHVP